MATAIVQGNSRTISIGPFVDPDTGAVRTDLVIAAADVLVSKNEDKLIVKDSSDAATHDQAGFYQTSLSGLDTDSPGSLVVVVNVAGALPVWKEYEVLPTIVYAQRVTEGVTALLIENAVLDAILAAHGVGGSVAEVLTILAQRAQDRFTAEGA